MKEKRMMEIKPRESLKYGDRYLYPVTESGKSVVGLQWVGDYYYLGDVYATLQE